MRLSEIISIFESAAPTAYQEEYDNAGLNVGDPDTEISAALLCIDVTDAIIEEAIQKGANLVISHHPVLYHPVKSITGRSYTERILRTAIIHGIALYSAHTNFDNIFGGVNREICRRLGLINLKILSPIQEGLKKLVTYVPSAAADDVRNALFEAGAGHIGKYDSCSFNIEGTGSFRAAEGTNPYVGEIGKTHFENETRIETIFPGNLKPQIIKVLLRAHPYEEVAYDIFPVENEFIMAGSGMIGDLKEPADTLHFLNQVKTTFNCRILRHSRLIHSIVNKVAVCGGSGSFLIQKAISAGADVFITGDIKYHQFFDAHDQIIAVDIGHYESEQFTVELFYDILKEKLPNFAVHFSDINTNPIHYF
jgi:dinuclear metal center YbgI/SA1388 family protein